jgi:hypothetical protein
VVVRKVRQQRVVGCVNMSSLRSRLSRYSSVLSEKEDIELPDKFIFRITGCCPFSSMLLFKTSAILTVCKLIELSYNSL